MLKFLQLVPVACFLAGVRPDTLGILNVLTFGRHWDHWRSDSDARIHKVSLLRLVSYWQHPIDHWQNVPYRSLIEELCSILVQQHYVLSLLAYVHGSLLCQPADQRSFTQSYQPSKPVAF